jgi:dimethylargininase
MLTAITRDVSRTLGACELSYVERTPIDVDRAQRQHRAYQAALTSLGCRVIALPAEHELPDAVFVEDVALVFDEIAIRTRPGAASRRPEVASVANALASYRTMRSIEAPGTIDGGDVLRIGRTIYVGRSARSNAAAVEQLQAIVGPSALGPRGYAVQPVSTRGCLHLKSAVTEVADGVVLINPEWVDRAVFARFRRIEIDPDEPHAANGLRVGGGLIYPTSFPRTTRRLADAGVAVTTVDVSELQKAEGAVTCCSILFNETATA